MNQWMDLSTDQSMKGRWMEVLDDKWKNVRTDELIDRCCRDGRMYLLTN